MNPFPLLWNLSTAALPATATPVTLAEPTSPTTALSTQGNASYRILPLSHERKTVRSRQLGDYELPRGEQTQDAHPRKR